VSRYASGLLRIFTDNIRVLVDPWDGIVRSGTKREVRKGRTSSQFLFLHKAHIRARTSKVASTCTWPDSLQFRAEEENV
jgi:hypothetical protein